jgi:hypothetical protein
LAEIKKLNSEDSFNNTSSTPVAKFGPQDKGRPRGAKLSPKSWGERSPHSLTPMGEHSLGMTPGVKHSSLLKNEGANRETSPLGAKFTQWGTNTTPKGRFQPWGPTLPLGAKFIPRGTNITMGAYFTPGGQPHPWGKIHPEGDKYHHGGQLNPWGPTSPPSQITPLWTKLNMGLMSIRLISLGHVLM